MDKEWAVVEHAGFTNERVVSTWSTYDDAWCAYQEQYTDSERDELFVDIMKWDDEAQDWTWEY